MVRHIAVFEPNDLSRRQRRKFNRDAARSGRELEPAKARRRDRTLPDAVVPGPFGSGIGEGSYWNLARPSIPSHQATSRQIAGIYPFIADGGLGHRGPILGVDLNADA